MSWANGATNRGVTERHRAGHVDAARRMALSNLFAAAIFVLPAVLVFTVLVVVPMAEAGFFSLYRWNGYGVPTDFVGLDNYVRLFKTKVFHTAFINNLLIIAVSLVVQIPLALWLATLVSHRIPGATFFRAIFFLPYVLADIAAGLIWTVIYDGNYGLIAGLAPFFGFEAPFVLADRDWAMPALLVVIVWKFFGFHMMLFIAGMQAIPKDYYEAAEMDGASRWQRFWRITMPLLKPTLYLSIFFSVLGSLQTFDVVMPLTQGGPSNRTQTIVTFMYQHGVSRMQVGFGTAIGVVLFLVSVVFAFTYKRAVMRDE